MFDAAQIGISLAGMKPFKRKFNADGTEDRNAPYYVKFMVKGKSHLWSTKTNYLPRARERAKAYREAIVAERFHLADSMKSRSTVPTFGEIFKQYLELPLTIAENTRRKNIAGLRMMLKASGISDDDKIDRLGAAVVVKFQKAGLAEGVPPSTLNSRLRAAKSIFSARALIGYVPQLPLAYVQDMQRVPALREPERLPEVPTKEALALAHQQLPAHPDVYRCFLLALYGGLRAGEIAAARWDWLDGDVIYVGGREFHAKSRKWRTVRLHPEALRQLHECGPKTGEHIAGLHPTKIATRQLAPMLRALGFNFRDPTHACRRWAGSMVADKQGLRAAQLMLGHSSPAVTDRSYARQVNVPDGAAMPGGSATFGVGSAPLAAPAPFPQAPESISP